MFDSDKVKSKLFRFKHSVSVFADADIILTNFKRLDFLYKALIDFVRQSNSTITNSSRLAKFVRYNRVSLEVPFCLHKRYTLLV